ncbi:hypothetical protein N7540_004554 [Penicillium herquei]|nr:hypothetical protein N7540_004554 [Penicillium herquei]
MMDQYTGFCILIFILSVAYLYFLVTKRIPSRLEPNQAPKSRFGLVPAYNLHSPARARGVDIIFVHGLGSNPDKTWCTRKTPNTNNSDVEAEPNSKRNVNWVSDLLPDYLPPETCKEVRMFFYNYDSYWKRDAVYTRLKLEGNNLLEHIRQIRGTEQEKRRPLIFVGHSYGGQVIKQALIQSQAGQDFGDIAEHTRTAIFLGTPHRGSSVGPWGWLVAQALQPLGSNPLIVANLEYDSLSLFDLHDQFTRWQFLCVREQSATYVGRNVRNIGLPIDHYGLNKFGSKDANFQSISSAIVETITSLVQPQNHSYSAPIESVQTFSHREQLWDDLERKLQIRHDTSDIPYAVTLAGLGGTGKSQLALKYAESRRSKYNPVLWIDATNEESVRSSFRRCAAELGLRDEHKNQDRTALVDDPIVQGVLRWLRDRTELDERWLVIVDNADDIGWGIKKVIPKGKQGSLIVTSRDEQSQKLIDRRCEKISVDVMSPLEARDVLLQHLSIQGCFDLGKIQNECDEVTRRLGYLPLAVDLAGAYLGNEPEPCEALSQYFDDFEKYHDALLKMNELRGLSPTEKTVWTVWDTTLDKIDKENDHFQPGLLLTFMAHFKGPIIQD